MKKNQLKHFIDLNALKTGNMSQMVDLSQEEFRDVLQYIKHATAQIPTNIQLTTANVNKWMGKVADDSFKHLSNFVNSLW